MLFISDPSTIEARSKWRIINKDILDKKKELTYFSPGGYCFKDKYDRQICFDWCDSRGDYDENDKSIIEATQYSFDYDFITSSLEDDKNFELIQEEYRLELFKDFVEFIELHCTIDIDKEEVPQEGNIECIYFELFEPASGESLVLLNKEDK